MQTKQEYEKELEGIKKEIKEANEVRFKIFSDISEKKQELEILQKRVVKDRAEYTQQAEIIKDNYAEEHKQFIASLKEREKIIRLKEQEIDKLQQELNFKGIEIANKEELVYNLIEQNNRINTELNERLERFKEKSKEQEADEFYIKISRQASEASLKKQLENEEYIRKQREKLEKESEQFEKYKKENDKYWNDKELELQKREDILKEQGTLLANKEQKIKSDLLTLKSAKQQIQSLLNK